MSFEQNWELKIDSGVYKDLSKIPKNYTKKILKAIDLLQYNPYLGDIEKIKGQDNLYRRRIGAYRFFYELHTNLHKINVLWVERRTSSTY